MTDEAPKEDSPEQYKIYEVSAGSGWQTEYMLVAPDDTIQLGRHQGKYFDLSVIIKDGATIWDRNPRNRCELVSVVSRKDVKPADIQGLEEMKPEDLEQIAKGE